MNEPKISVIVPCYNQAQYLSDALESVLSQTYPHWECIIIDDGSSDHTSQVGESYVKKDSRFKFKKSSNRGASGSRNVGLDMISGRYVQFLDADDIILNTKWDLQLKQLQSTGAMGLSYTDYYISSEKKLMQGKLLRINPKLRGNPLHDLIWRWETSLSIPIHTFLFDSNVFTTPKLRFDESLKNHVDWDCWLKVFRLKPEIYYIGQKLAVYRIHPQSMIRKTQGDNLCEGFQKAIKKNMELFPAESVEYTLLRKKYDLTEMVFKKYAGIRFVRIYFLFIVVMQALLDNLKSLFKME